MVSTLQQVVVQLHGHVGRGVGFQRPCQHVYPMGQGVVAGVYAQSSEANGAGAWGV
jgi:hypothetical protein